MQNLPKSLSKKLERFKRVRGPTWAKDLEEILDRALLEARIIPLRQGPPLTDAEAEQLAVEEVRAHRKEHKSR